MKYFLATNTHKEEKDETKKQKIDIEQNIWAKKTHNSKFYVYLWCIVVIKPLCR